MAASHSAFKWTPLGYRQLTSLSAATGLGAIPNDTVIVLIQCESKDVRWRDDGIAPTASVGMPLAAGQEFQYTVVDFTQIQFIEQTAGAKLNISFFK